jgi:hypothetical protein
MVGVDRHRAVATRAAETLRKIQLPAGRIIKAAQGYEPDPLRNLDIRRRLIPVENSEGAGGRSPDGQALWLGVDKKSQLPSNLFQPPERGKLFPAPRLLRGVSSVPQKLTNPVGALAAYKTLLTQTRFKGVIP